MRRFTHEDERGTLDVREQEDGSVVVRCDSAGERAVSHELPAADFQALVATFYDAPSEAES